MVSNVILWLDTNMQQMCFSSYNIFLLIYIWMGIQLVLCNEYKIWFVYIILDMLDD